MSVFCGMSKGEQNRVHGGAVLGVAAVAEVVSYERYDLVRAHGEADWAAHARGVPRLIGGGDDGIEVAPETVPRLAFAILHGLHAGCRASEMALRAAPTITGLCPAGPLCRRLRRRLPSRVPLYQPLLPCSALRR